MKHFFRKEQRDFMVWRVFDYIVKVDENNPSSSPHALALSVLKSLGDVLGGRNGGTSGGGQL